jgi:tetratricopeptide (TPR) repeat protein
MRGQGTDKRDKSERREDALRPSRYLGYDRDTLGMHMMSCEAYPVAEASFRRAVWLNPFEPRFKAHLAWCLLHQARYSEAREWISLACEQDPQNEECRRVLAIIQASPASNAPRPDEKKGSET